MAPAQVDLARVAALARRGGSYDPRAGTESGFRPLVKAILALRTLRGKKIVLDARSGSVTVGSEKDENWVYATPGWDGATDHLPVSGVDPDGLVLWSNDVPVTWTGEVQEDGQVGKAAVLSQM